MAGNNLRSNRGRDPLADLARLIAQAAPCSESASGDAYQMNERYSHAGELHMLKLPTGRALTGRSHDYKRHLDDNLVRGSRCRDRQGSG